MQPISIVLPAGMLKNATPYARRGHWEDGSLVRWHNGSVRPIGGWQRRGPLGVPIAPLIADSDLEAVRDIFAWRDLAGGQQVVFGSNLALYHMAQAGGITDITYAGYVPDNPSKDAGLDAGYGENPYGVGVYGAANNFIGSDPTPPDRWYFDNFGEVLLTGVRRNGGIYELDLGTLTLSAVSGAPSDIQDLVVTDQRQVFVIGGAGEPRRVRASEIEDRTDWVPAVDNQVIDRTLTGSGTLMRCVNVLRQILILGENDAHVARYIGPPYVYSIDLAGENCGPIAAEAVANTDRFAVWWGRRNFWIYDGSVQVMDCAVIDFLYSDINPLQVSKISSFTNTDYSEIWWLYQSQSSVTGEVDSYVIWDYKENHWATGRLNRTAGIDKGVLLFPVMVDNAGAIYNHELDDVFPSGEGNVFVATGALDIASGGKNMAVRDIWPDTEAASDVTFTIYGKEFPNATEYTYGPYAYANPINTRAMGRSVRIRADFQQVGAELGAFRIVAAPVGTGGR